MNSPEKQEVHEANEKAISSKWSLYTGILLLSKHPLGVYGPDYAIAGPHPYLEVRSKDCVISKCRTAAPKMPEGFGSTNRRPTRSGVTMTYYEFSQHHKPFYFAVQFNDGLYDALIDPSKVDAPSWDGIKSDGTPDFCVFFPVEWFRKLS